MCSLGFGSFGLFGLLVFLSNAACGYLFLMDTGWRSLLDWVKRPYLISCFLFGTCTGGLRFEILVPLALLITFFLFSSSLKEIPLMVSAAWRAVIRAPFTSIVIFVLLTIYFLGACVPEREVDSLWYHLAVPLYYITHGGFIQLVPFNMPSHYPMNVHLHYTFSLLIGNDTAVKVFLYCHFIPFLILLWSTVKRFGREEWGLFAVAVYLCCLHFRLPVMANVQRAVYFHVFLSYVLLWEALETRRWDLFILSSLFCGMAMGTKFNGLLFGYVPQWLFLAGWILCDSKTRLFENGLKWITHSVIAWLMMSPWLIKSLILTGNPLYPMMGELFSTRAEFIHAMESNARNHGLNILKSDTSVGFCFSNSNQSILASLQCGFDFLSRASLFGNSIDFTASAAAASHCVWNNRLWIVYDVVGIGYRAFVWRQLWCGCSIDFDYSCVCVRSTYILVFTTILICIYYCKFIWNISSAKIYLSAESEYTMVWRDLFI